jgi:hypothetical protein
VNPTEPGPVERAMRERAKAKGKAIRLRLSLTAREQAVIENYPDLPASADNVAAYLAASWTLTRGEAYDLIAKHMDLVVAAVDQRNLTSEVADALIALAGGERIP